MDQLHNRLCGYGLFFASMVRPSAKPLWSCGAARQMVAASMSWDQLSFFAFERY